MATAAKSKKAQKVVILDMRKVASFCDYFVIVSGTSLRQVNAIARGIEDDLAQEDIKSLSKLSRNDESGWVALDFVSVVAHVFYKPVREFYALERLWSDAKKVALPRKPH
ncbi:MAG: ribosome silencing factor [Candidatus Omnitrophica bacterium]|nr:ribosome silencing factor [Candidatus Omnitrophota bacterium]